MPRVTCLSGLGKPIVVDNVTTVIVETEQGTAIAVVTETVPGGYALIPATDPDFNRIIGGLGLDRIEVKTLKTKFRSHSGKPLADMN